MMSKKNNLIFTTAASMFYSSAVLATQPNVVVILIDDMGWKDLGVYGSDFYETPNIDQLARESTIFTNAYAACTVSSPTRASIVTGKYPAKLHITDWIEGWKYPDAKLKVPDWTMYLSHDETTMAELFKNAGYSTIHVGKWHLGEDEKYWPENHGFDINIAGWAKGAPSLNRNTNKPNGYFSPYGNPRLQDGTEGEYLTERLTSEVCDVIEQQSQSAPFFINMWFYNVHTPLQAKQEKIDRYAAMVDDSKKQNNPVYAAMVEHVDDAIGNIVNKLKEKGLYDNTIILFTSDNGGLIGRGKQVTNNYPLRSGKGTEYEGGVKVPFFIKQANGALQNPVDESLIMTIDILPTLLDMAKIKYPNSLKKEIDGISLVPVLNNKGVKRDELFWHYPHYHAEGATPYSAVRKGDWKLIHKIETGTYELYNLKEDIEELNNLASVNSKKVRQMKIMLEKWKKKMNAQMPVNNQDYKEK
jgi:arylsulfatase A-like enzyme